MELMLKSLESDPEFALVYVALGEIFIFRNTFREYFKENPMDSVLLLANQALRLDPDLADAYLLRAQYYYFLEGFKSRAKNDMEKAISLDPNNPDAFAILGSWNRTAGHYPEALENLLKSKRLVRGDELEYVNSRLGYFYATIGDYQQAMEITENLLTIQPDYLPGLTLKAHLNRCQGKSHLNLPIAQKILMLDNSGARAGMVGLIYMMNNDYQQAEHYFEKYFSLAEEKLSIRASDEIHMYVYTLLKNGKKELAAEKSKEGEQHFLAISSSSRPRAPSMGYELAKLYAMRGERDKALMWLKDYEKFGFEVGLHDFARYDPPFENLWRDSEFMAIMERVSKKIASEREKIERLQREGYFDI
jgi:tetratricopeptide (TPR) repeat protein